MGVRGCQEKKEDGAGTTNDVASGCCATVCANDDASVELDGHDGCLRECTWIRSVCIVNEYAHRG